MIIVIKKGLKPENIKEVLHKIKDLGASPHIVEGREQMTVSVLGKTEKDIDLDVYSPSTQKRAFVQIKSTTTRAEIQSYIETYQEYEQFNEMYFVYHTCHADLSDIELLYPNVHLWGLKRLAGLVVNAGLAEWLINKRT